MDNAKPTSLKISRNCDEISAHHFFKLRDTKDLQWLYPKYDGWKEITDRLPENAQAVADDIADEYSKLTKNNTTLQYMESIDDIELAATRIYGASILLDAIESRWYLMSDEIQKEYVETLGKWNFLLNTSKPLKDELSRLHRQLRAAKTKLKRLEADKALLEEKFDKQGVDIVQLVVQVKNVLKRDLDLKKITIKEWHYTLESIPRKKAA